jgi:uncharacterized delta-60 repeat protein
LKHREKAAGEVLAAKQKPSPAYAAPGRSVCASVALSVTSIPQTGSIREIQNMVFSSWLRSLKSRWLHSSTRRLRPSRPWRGRPSVRPLLEQLEDRLTPTAGVLDPTFGAGAGYVLSSVGGTTSAVAVQSNGQIVTAGSIASSTKSTISDFSVTRYNADGSLDTSFGTGGYTDTNFTPNKVANNLYESAADAVAIQSDGKILAAGKESIFTAKTGLWASTFAMARYNANGTLDTTFGNNGEVVTAGDAGASSIVVQADGKILTSGSNNLLVRYNANGSLDTTFGSGGKVATNFSGPLLIQPDGKIVVAGSLVDPANGKQEFAVARFNADGTADSSFGSGGEVTTQVGSLGSYFGGVALQADGKIVVSGYGSMILPNGSPCLVRYNADGTLDTTFGTSGNGIVNVPDPGSWTSNQRVSVEVQSDGKIVATQLLGNSSTHAFGVVRVNSDGSLDTSYGNGGWATVGSGYVSSLFASTLEPDGRLLLVGSSSIAADRVLIRLLQSEPEIGSFTANPNPVASGSSTTLTASNITDGNPNSTITQVTFYYFDANGNKVVLGTGTADGSGDWILNFTVNLASGSYTLYAQAQDNYGVLGDPAALTLTVE